MKKLLLATTAAAALTLGASAARAEIDLDLGGYFKGYAGYNSQDGATRSFDIKRKSEVFFTGETTLDNGLTVGYYGELFQENSNSNESPSATATSPTNELEESYLYLSGNWGRVNLGRENNAAYLLQVAAPGADANIDGQDISFSFINMVSGADQDYKQAGIEGANSIAATQYADKITYLTPKFNGFQAGVSYSPELDSKGFGNNVSGMQSDVGATDLENAIDGGLRYDGEFSGVGVHVGGGYSYAGQEIDTAGDDDYQEWNAGLKLTYEGFGFGGAYNTDNGAADNADTDNWTVGADYTYGAYTFGASYFSSETDVADGEFDRWTVGANYTYGPGMSFRGAVGIFDDEATGVDNDGTFVTLGTDVQF
ncbi:MAG TPA: porin [Alphaproteobacteria bacterium]